jgi:hypothetical protein
MLRRGRDNRQQVRACKLAVPVEIVAHVRMRENCTGVTGLDFKREAKSSAPSSRSDALGQSI